jgi:hypothetical protein
MRARSPSAIRRGHNVDVDATKWPDHDQELLERDVEDALFRDYPRAGRNIRRLKNEGEWRGEHKTWESYVEERFGVSRGRSYVLMQAAEVADDVSAQDDTIRLPQRHAQLLHPFNSEDRVRLARKIQRLTRAAAIKVIRHELARGNEPTKAAAPPPSETRNEILEQLSNALKAIDALHVEDCEHAVSGLRPVDRKRLAQTMSRRIQRLRTIASRIQLR